MLRIDSNIIWTILNLLILYALMMKFLFKPVRGIIAKRQEEIQTSYDEVKQTQEETQKKKEQVDAQLDNIQEICNGYIVDAKKKASEEYDEIIESANSKSNEIIETARQNAEHVMDEEKRKAQDEVAAMIRTAAFKIAGETNDEKLYDDFLKEME